jgi:putative phage-type endonuclease
MLSNKGIVPVWDKTEQEWLEMRSHGVGGSDSGTICGVDKYSSALVLWSEKVGHTKREFSGNAATRWGHRLEDDVAEAYAEDYNKAIVAWPVLIWSSDPEHPFMYANLDYVEVTPSEQFPAGVVTRWESTDIPPGIIDIVECKTTGIATHGAAHDWDKGKAPDKYLVQTYHYIIVVRSLGIGLNHATLVCLVAGQENLAVRKLGTLPDDDILWDEEIEQNILIAEEQFWWCVENDIEPEIDGSDTTEEFLAARYPRSVPDRIFEAGEDFRAMVEEFTARKKATKDAEAAEKEYRSKIVAVLGDAEAATFEGELLLTFKSGSDRKTFDAERLKKEDPLLYEQYTKTSPGSRTLLIK